MVGTEGLGLGDLATLRLGSLRRSSDGRADSVEERVSAGAAGDDTLAVAADTCCASGVELASKADAAAIVDC